METFYLALSTITLLLSFFTGLIAISKRPRSGMKTSFSILCAVIFLSNLHFIISDYFAIDNSVNSFLVRDYFLFVSAIFFAYNFPNFFRNIHSVSYLIWFLVGGISFLLLQNIRDLSYSSLFYPFVVIFVYFSFAWVVWKKTWDYFKNIRNFIIYSSIVYSFTILMVAYYQFTEYQPFLRFQDNIPLFGINFIFTLIYVIFLFRFTFASTYTATPISILFEKSRQVFHQVENANAKGSIQLKRSLIHFYDTSSIKDFVDSFDFHLLVDETIDNAIEHGGKRSYDDINVYIIETKKSIDIYVIDRGKGFDPKRLPSPLREDRKLIPSGRGIHLLKELFEVRWNFLGNEVCVRIRKPIS